MKGTMTLITTYINRCLKKWRFILINPLMRHLFMEKTLKNKKKILKSHHHLWMRIICKLMI